MPDLLRVAVPNKVLFRRQHLPCLPRLATASAQIVKISPWLTRLTEWNSSI